MGRTNENEKIINYENTIKKSNDLSMAKLNQGLSLNQMQLLAFAIFSTQKNGKTEFRKYEFQDKFGIKNYKTDDAYLDSQKLSIIQFSTKDLENNKFSFTNVFSSITYESGHSIFEWNPKMIPHILELKDKYVLTDLTITSNFKSGFSWILYDYLKAHFGNWYKELSKEAILTLFSVEKRKTYVNSTSEFKRGVLNVAIEEINEYTELKVWYSEKKTGNKITNFVLHWSTGSTVSSATDKQINLLREIHEEVEKSMFDYLAVKEVESARDLIIKSKEINGLVKKGMSIKDADNNIKESLSIYKQLENLLEVDGKARDISIYYNWLEEV